MKQNFLYLELLIVALIVNIYMLGISFNSFFLSLFLIINYMYFNNYHKKRSITFLIIGWYMCGLYFQYIFLKFNPELFTSYGISIYLLNDVISINSAIITSLLFFLFFLISFNLSAIFLMNFKKIKPFVQFKKIRLEINPVYLLLVISVVEYIVRVKLNIAVPGMPNVITIPYVTNVLYFSIIASKLFILRSILNNLAIKFNSFSYKLVMLSIFLTLIFSLPSMLLGWRGSFVTTYIFVFLYFFLVMNKKRRLKYLTINILFALPIGVYIIYKTALIRGSVTNEDYYLYNFLLNRFVGWADAIAVENYLINNGKYAISNFLHGESLTSFHTINVRGFPQGIINAYSRPIFSSLKLLMGNMITIVGAIILGIIIAGIENNIKMSRSNFILKDVFILVYLIFDIFLKVIFSGDIQLLVNDYPVLIFVYIILSKFFILGANIKKVT
jgi:hypothetical protein